MAVMPMFPLGTPLLPGSILPLHVFEPRYRQMMHDILADDANDPQFGVVMIERGSEVGGGDQRSDVGTVARIIDIQVTSDGRFSLIAVGTDRLRVTEWLPDSPYPAADIALWPDDDSDEVTSDTIDELHERVLAVNDLVREIGQNAPPADTEISDDRRLAVFHLAALSPVGAADRQRVLAAAGSLARVDVLRLALDDTEAALRFRRT